MAQEKLDISTDKKMDSVENFKFEPIKGYPMLNWKGKRPFTTTQFYPAQLKETYGKALNGWMNKIFWGDNLQVMSHLLRIFRGKVDLVYIDPPFDSKADYKKKIKLKNKQVTNDQNSFEEKQYTDIWTNDAYLQFIYERLILIKELLSPKGVIALHCDSSRGHYIKCIMDEIFGGENFVNAITWQRSLAHGDTGQGAKHFGRVSDYIHVFSKGNDFTFNPQYIPYSKEIIKRDYKYTDEKTGKLYRLVPVDGPGGAAKGNPYYEFLGVSMYFRYSKEKMQKLYDNGEIVISKTGRTIQRKKFLKDAKGTPVHDLWNDLKRVSPSSNERLNYPTQKPEVLLERIVKTFSNENDLVFDCFVGSGTTAAVAENLNRRFIVADINIGAIETTIQRLISINNVIPVEVFNVNNYDIFRNPIQAKEILIDALEIQPLPGNTIYDGEKDGRMVKIMPVNRISTRADLNDLIMGFNYKSFEKSFEKVPGKPVESLLLICMGHEPDLAASLQKEVPYKLDIEVVDILRDKSNLEFKRDSEAIVEAKNNEIVVKEFYPMNLLQKLSIMKENVEDWRELVESIKVDFNYDGSVFEPTIVDVPSKNDMVIGSYIIPEDSGTIRVKITDLLSESFEISIEE